MVSYAIIDVINEYRPYSDCPKYRNRTGVYTMATMLFSANDAYDRIIPDLI